ncbi:MAG: hypothetical protein Q7K55_08530 [Candidatus Levybacteria bacterium]|nr:hypothetical protein [Candidatus Levybacteria bacterium]
MVIIINLFLLIDLTLYKNSSKIKTSKARIKKTKYGAEIPYNPEIKKSNIIGVKEIRYTKCLFIFFITFLIAQLITREIKIKIGKK